MSDKDLYSIDMTDDDNIESFENSYLDCEAEIKKKKDEDAETMLELTNELKSIKKSGFKDFNLIMKDYHSGDENKRKRAIDDACVNLKGFIVYMIMHNFWTYCRNNFYDMLQSGYLGVMKGMETYNPERAKPTTFFKTYIKSEISRYITEFLNHSTVHYASALNKVNKAIRYFEANDIEYNEVIIAEYLGMSLISVKEALASKEAAINVDYQDELENESTDSVSIKPGTDVNPEHYMEEKEKREAIMNALQMLSEDEKYIIMAHYGFLGNEVSLKDIAKHLNMSVANVKICHQKALNLLSNPLKGMYSSKYESENWLTDDYNFFPESEAEIESVDFSLTDLLGSSSASDDDE